MSTLAIGSNATAIWKARRRGALLAIREKVVR
jgi:hypothetical protein